MAEIRSIICSVLGHVDHGKSTVLDNIRNSSIVATEAGAITQAIGASIIPLKVLKKICGPLLESLKMQFTVPGILAIDTPGHAAFTNLRKRGGNLADIGILVVDINEGFKPQTEEAVEILKTYKTPFIVAANKIDLLPGWQTKKDNLLLKSISLQKPEVVQKIETKMYELVGKLHELGFEAERFDRVTDYTKQIAIVPVSAKTGEGIPELLMVLTGLAQKFLEQCLKCNVKGPAMGTILEVKEEKGLGTTVDAIIYDGTLKVNDTIVIGGLDKPVVTKVRALFEPAPLAEMRDKKSKFKSVKKVVAATGVKISAPEIQEVVAGMPLRSTTQQNLEKVKREIQLEVGEVLIETDKEGIIIKADSLGSLEALIGVLKQKSIPIRRASIGNITKKDLMEAESNFEKDPLKSAVMGFSVVDDSGASSKNVKVLTNNVIYKLLEDFDKWQVKVKQRMEAAELDKLTRPCKIEVMKGYVFRQSNPAVVGVDVLVGVLKTGTALMKKDGKEITTVKSMQHEKESINTAEKGKQVAAALNKVTVGRQINEGDILYSSIPEPEFREMKKYKKHLKPDEIALMKEIAEIKRKDKDMWGF